MPSLSDVPFLGGYLGQQAVNRTAGDDVLRQATGYMTLQGQAQQQQLQRTQMESEAAMRAAAQEAGGDITKFRESLVRMGRIKDVMAIDAEMRKTDAEKARAEYDRARTTALRDPKQQPSHFVTTDQGQMPVDRITGAPRGPVIPGTAPAATQAPMSPLGRLMTERDALPEGDPRRVQYDRVIQHAQSGGGANVTVNPTLSLGKEAGNKVDTGLLDTTKGTMTLSTIEGQFKPQYQQFMPRISAGWTALKDSAGMNVSPQDKQSLAEFSGYKRNAINSMNQYIKEITGAAMSEMEAQRILKGMPNPGQGIFDGDSPTEFKAKLDDAMKQTKMALARYTYIKRIGIALSDANGEPVVPLNRMPQLMNERAKVLEGGIKKADPNLTQAQLESRVRQRLAQEFGLVQ